jgi:uncharacterized protein with von Willebrand factor type A (vWA) domain
VLTFCRAAAALGPFDRADLRWAARATLVSRQEDLAVLDALFERYFGDPSAPEGAAAPDALTPSRKPNPERPASQNEPAEVVTAASWRAAALDDELDAPSAIRVVASDAEVLRTKDFADLTEEERRAALAVVRRLTFSMPERRSRRYRSARSGDRFDFRRTVRQSLRTEGEPFRRKWKARQARPRPLVLVLDVSGSMAPYGRPLVEFAHAASRAGRKVEVFCFGTRLTRITRAVRARAPGEALAEVGATVTDWEGGTRIGDSLKELLDTWATRSALRGSVVVLCSDGLERGDPELLARQMERLSRLAHRLVWVNPLKGSPRYEPLARGMATALPFVDVFLPGHNLESLEALSAAVALA